MQLRNVSEGWQQCNADTPKRWLMLSAFGLARRAIRFDAW